MMPWLVTTITALVGTLVFLWERWQHERTKRVVERQAESLERQAADVRAWQEKAARLEALVARLKTDVARMEEEADACADPVVLRSRLRRLFSPHANADAAGGVPGEAAATR